ncbi:MAG TPA: GNAT family N-acetyltransferase, partial [Anaerolineales bacterium]|nr:GNAT family N-acetyltransferase [Anaerolineales bacterium]
SEILAYCDMGIEDTGSNEHIAFFRIEVLPEYRCQGLGRRMLGMLLPFAQDRKRSLLMIWMNDRVPAASIFLERMGGRRGQEGRMNQLKVSELDRDLITCWLQEGEPLQSEFDMGLWEGGFPDEHIDEIATLLQQLANDQPRDDLEMEDMKITPEIIHQVEKNMFARGEELWALYVLDRANQKLVGWTEVTWNPNRPMILNQGFTAVDSTYRNKGLGRWLKAAMMKKILQDRPQVEFIRTRNANSNAPMLKINNEMGFKPYHAFIAWQVNTEQVENYLSKNT